MTIHDDSYGDDPPPMDPVRRDPTLGLRRHTPYKPDAAPAADRITVKTIVATVAVVVGACVLVVMLGVAAHGIWRAIMLGWSVS